MINSLQFKPQINPIKLQKLPSSKPQGLAQLRHDAFVSSTSFGNLRGEDGEYPERFKAVEEGVLYKGASITKQEEFNSIVYEKGVRSIISFLPANLSWKELDFVDKFNTSHPNYPISHSVINLWDCGIKSERRPGLEAEFVRKVNELPKPIYMHCLAGIHISGEMEQVFKQAVKDGSIQLSRLKQ